MEQSTALDILKTGQSAFITGAPGTGKTYVVNAYIRYLESHGVMPYRVAPTGIAATHIGGHTVHSFFQLGIKDHLTDHDIRLILKKPAVASRLKKLKVLIIDEVSMLSPKLFEAIDRILRAYHKSDLSFAGIQVILSGDFFQLPPVSKEPVEERFIFQSSSWDMLDPFICYLKKSYRQNDNILLQILGEIRTNNVSEESMNHLRRRYKQPPANGVTPIKLYTHNKDIDRINAEELALLPGEARHFEAESRGKGASIDKIFKSSLVKEELELKAGASVMFIKNSPEQGYINGTQGTVTGFDPMTGMPVVKISSGRHIFVSMQEWTLTDHNGKTLATVEQIPLRLAWAITVHKSQGMTLDSAEMDLSKTFEKGQGYVAFSRVTALENITLMGCNPVALMVDEYVQEQDCSMQLLSDTVEAKHHELTKKELSTLHEVFLENIGGFATPLTEAELKKRKEQPAKKKSTMDVTKSMLLEGKDLEEISHERGIAYKTILGHAEKLLTADPDLDISHLRPEEEVYSAIEKAVRLLLHEEQERNFLQSGRLKKKALYEALGEHVSYEDISEALLFIPHQR